MTNEEIIKALKCCNRGICKDCAAKECMDLECVHNLSQNALRLINDQQEEIESIKAKRAMVFKFSEEQMNELKNQILKSIEIDVEEIKHEAYEQLISKIKATRSKDLLKIITDLTNK